ncbi:hypothetical protein LWI29_022571 [Acer saccharum]|uniref:Uncharacterized protein n=1 Tax=Acer saccharum TaxID=4024 RepID=A0AA39VD28_ACESA|nr:hypothetical protein LWI29_022571 [Acer saccharum]
MLIEMEIQRRFLGFWVFHFGLVLKMFDVEPRTGFEDDDDDDDVESVDDDEKLEILCEIEGFDEELKVRVFYWFGINVVVEFSPRSSNQFADKLAKLGSSMKGNFVDWGDFDN